MSNLEGFLEPPANDIKAYDHTKRVVDQPKDKGIPQVFLDAMEIRERVFVDEQHVPLENEVDPDDKRSFHWVLYASVAPSPAPNNNNNNNNNNGTITNKGTRRESREEQRRRSESIATRVPVATLRLVPPPHPPHPEPNSRLRIDNADNVPTVHRTRATSFHNGLEPYIKLGRLATIPEYRGKGLSQHIIRTALRYAMNNPDKIYPELDPAALEAARVDGHDPKDFNWNGLVLVHAQRDNTVKLWERYGFKLDEEMGEWDEEGIAHVGMWRRLEVVR